jgi:hypothetical protein
MTQSRHQWFRIAAAQPHPDPYFASRRSLLLFFAKAHRFNNSGNFATLAAIRRASSRVRG